jgi:hypothetical protein
MLSLSAVDRAVARLSHLGYERARRHSTPPRKIRRRTRPAGPRIATPGLDYGQDGGEGQRGRRHGGEEERGTPIQEKIPGHCSRHADFAHPLLMIPRICSRICGDPTPRCSVPAIMSSHTVLTCNVLIGGQRNVPGFLDDHEQSGGVAPCADPVPGTADVLPFTPCAIPGDTGISCAARRWRETQ